MLETIRDRLTSVQTYIVLGDSSDLPQTTLSPVYAYEELLRNANPDFAYPTDLDENAPMGMCYTSATTRNPKGVLYSHRGVYLHSMALCGGSAAPKSLIRTYEEKHGIPFVHAYGMTETSPLVTVARLKSHQTDLPLEQRLDFRATQGYMVPGLEMRLVGDQGDIPWDGQQFGELLLRGPWVADSYYNDGRSKETFGDGWLHTGDVVAIDSEGFVRLVDRTKDLVKSGGEWISSVDLENALMAHPAIFEAAVVAVPHPKWHERPLAFVVLKDAEQPVEKTDLLEFLRGQFPKWWIPDDVIFLAEIPKTSVGKFMKRTLREQYQTYWTSAGAK